MSQRILVIGGGAAGLMAAVTAARLGAQVTLLERNTRIGKKLLVTGNGRCNYTNRYATPKDYYCANDGFVASTLQQFTPEDAIAFFQELGIEPKEEGFGKMFPMSEQASSFLDVFLDELGRRQVEVVTDCLVEQMTKQKLGFEVKTSQGTFQANQVIFCPGGKAMPSTGSDGTAYDLVKPLGHQVTPIFPSLVQLMLIGDFFQRIDGVKVKGRAWVESRGEVLHTDEGDLLFANYGISGPPILQLSRTAGQLLQDHRPATLHLCLLPYTYDALKEIVERRMSLGKTIEAGLIGLINKRLIPVLIQQAGIADSKRDFATLTHAEVHRLVNGMTDWTFTIRGTKSWPSAQGTAGGIDTAEVNPLTMESELVPGLYFAGEVLDVDGLCGGYNLQWAWSSGVVAARHACA